MQANYKKKILNAMLKHVPFDGWNEALFEVAASDMKTTPEALKLHFEGGIVSVVDYFLQENDKKMLEKIAKIPSDLRIRDKIAQGVLARLSLYEKQKPVIAKTVSFLSLPWHSPYCAKFAWRTCDLIWKHAGGDRSTDFNYYSKRSLLFGVYTATIIYWLADESKDYADTKRFLDDRIEDVMKIGKLIGKKR